MNGLRGSARTVASGAWEGSRPAGARIDTVFRCSYTYPIMVKSESGARSRALVWWGAVALTLLIGYADLVRGGETLAPILLVVGYCVLIPAAILKS
jgi:hypothetical protein